MIQTPLKVKVFAYINPLKLEDEIEKWLSENECQIERITPCSSGVSSHITVIVFYR